MTSDLSVDTEPSPPAGELQHPAALDPQGFKVTSGIFALRQTYSKIYIFVCFQ